MLRGDVSTCHPARIALHRDEVTGRTISTLFAGRGVRKSEGGSWWLLVHCQGYRRGRRERGDRSPAELEEASWGGGSRNWRRFASGSGRDIRTLVDTPGWAESVGEPAFALFSVYTRLPLASM